MKNSKEFCFVVLMQYTSKFVFFVLRHRVSNYPWRT